MAEFEGGDTPNPDVSIPSDIEINSPANLAYGNDSVVKRQSYSGFAQLTWHAMSNLRLTVGGRINYDHYTDDSYNFSGFGPPSTSSNEKSDTVPTWRAEIDYDATSDNMLYASAAKRLQAWRRQRQ